MAKRTTKGNTMFVSDFLGVGVRGHYDCNWDANIVLRDANNLGGTRFPSGGVQLTWQGRKPRPRPVMIAILSHFKSGSKR